MDNVTDDSIDEFYIKQQKMQQDMINGFSLINMADVVPVEVQWQES